MSHDAAPLQEIRGWLQRAAADLRAAEFELTAEPPLLEDIVFHAQQAAEKAFKAGFAFPEMVEDALIIAGRPAFGARLFGLFARSREQIPHQVARWESRPAPAPGECPSPDTSSWPLRGCAG